MIIDEHIRIHILDTIIMNLHINSEERTQKSQQLVPRNEIIQSLRLLHQYHQRPEEMHHYHVHNRIRIDRLQDRALVGTQLAKKLRNK